MSKKGGRKDFRLGGHGGKVVEQESARGPPVEQLEQRYANNNTKGGGGDRRGHITDVYSDEYSRGEESKHSGMNGRGHGLISELREPSRELVKKYEGKKAMTFIAEWSEQISSQPRVGGGSCSSYR